jgi:TonB family protein
VSQSLYDIYKPVRVGIGKFPLAAISTLVLLIFLGGAWRMHWVRLPWLGSYSSHKGISRDVLPADASKSQSAIAQTTAPEVPSTASSAVPVAKKPNAVPKTRVAEASSHSAGGAAEAPSAPATAEPELGFFGPATSAPLETAKPVAPTTAPKRANAKESGAATVSRGKSAPSAGPSATAQPVSSEPGASDTALVPPKLLKSVAPVYPPEAMENYITGDVRVDAVVEPDGKIGAMKILTGPAPLRQAALDALKQYEYAPATQGGKAVAAHVTATVKFWFNP